VGWGVGRYQAEAAVLGCKYPRHVRSAVGSGVGRHQSRGWLLRWLLLFLLLQSNLRRCQVARHACMADPMVSTIRMGGCLPRACSAAICCRSASTSPALVSAGASGMVLVVAVQGTARSCLLLDGATQCRARRSLSGRRAYIRQLPLQKNVHQKSGAETLITCICRTNRY